MSPRSPPPDPAPKSSQTDSQKPIDESPAPTDSELVAMMLTLWQRHLTSITANTPQAQTIKPLMEQWASWWNSKTHTPPNLAPDDLTNPYATGSTNTTTHQSLAPLIQMIHGLTTRQGDLERQITELSLLVTRLTIQLSASSPPPACDPDHAMSGNSKPSR